MIRCIGPNESETRELPIVTVVTCERMTKCVQKNMDGIAGANAMDGQLLAWEYCFSFSACVGTFAKARARNQPLARDSQVG